jgi:large-conductance mechanosensitive channel
LFLILRQLNKMMATKEPPPPPPEELAVLREIRDLMKARP